MLALHLATVLCAALLGALIFALRKGSRLHKLLGRAYMGFMLATAAITLFIPANAGPTLFSHFGFLHLLVVVTVCGVFFGARAARRGRVKTHRAIMLLLYGGAIVIAGALALLIPGRFLHTLLFS